MMDVINLIQGSPEWLDFRSNHYPASEAPAMMGEGLYEPKTPENLALVRLGLKQFEISSYQQKIFDDGHETERCARPIVERIIGEQLSNITGRIDEPRLSLGLSASLDGQTFDGEVLFEHKILNKKLVAQVKKKQLSPHYYWQLEQQLLVSGAKKVIFVTSDAFEVKEEDFAAIKDTCAYYTDPAENQDGVLTRFAATNLEYMEYTAVAGRAEELIQGWEKFEQVVAEVVCESDTWAEVSENFLALNEELKAAKDKVKEIDGQLKPYKTSLIDTAKSSGNTKMIGAGVEVLEVTRKGGLDEKLLLQFMTEEQLNQCRKANSSSWQVKESKIKLTDEQKASIAAAKKKLGDKPSIQAPTVAPSTEVMGAGAFNF